MIAMLCSFSIFLIENSQHGSVCHTSPPSCLAHHMLTALRALWTLFMKAMSVLECICVKLPLIEIKMYTLVHNCMRIDEMYTWKQTHSLAEYINRNKVSEYKALFIICLPFLLMNNIFKSIETLYLKYFIYLFTFLPINTSMK